MSTKRKIEVYLDEEVYAYYLARARSSLLDVAAVIEEIAQEHRAEEFHANEALARLSAPETAISLDEMRRRLAS